MERKTTKTVTMDGDELEGEFTQNQHGWFCNELNGIQWDYQTYGAQAAKSSPEEAAQDLWERVTQ